MGSLTINDAVKVTSLRKQELSNGSAQVRISQLNNDRLILQKVLTV